MEILFHIRRNAKHLSMTVVSFFQKSRTRAHTLLGIIEESQAELFDFDDGECRRSGNES